MGAYRSPVLVVGLLTCSAVSAQRAVTEGGGNGRIKGTLTFYFNANYGTRPDVGAKVLLIRESVDLPDAAAVILTLDELFVHAPGQAEKRYKAVAHTIADGNGTFELTDITPGQYSIIIQSSHVRGVMVPALVTTDKRGKPLKKPRVEMGVTQKDAGGRIIFHGITVEAGKTIEESHDFGISIF